MGLRRRSERLGHAGGGIDPGETHADAVRRELPEERWQTLAELHAIPTEPPVLLRAGAAAFTERLVREGHPAVPVELDF